MIIRDVLAPNPGPFTLSGTRTYLLGRSAVLDPGPAIDSHVEAIRAAMPNLKTILITHRHGDHAPAGGPIICELSRIVQCLVDDAQNRGP